MERKCVKCGTWNNDVDHCENCGAEISPVLIKKKRSEQNIKKLQSEKKAKLDIWLEQFKNSKNPIVKIFYHIMKTLWMIYMGIISFIIWFIAMGPG